MIIIMIIINIIAPQKREGVKEWGDLVCLYKTYQTAITGGH